MCVKGVASPHRRLSIPRVRWVGEARVQVRLSGRPHPFRRENRVGQGRLCPATGPEVRGDNKQGPVSRDRREGRHSNELPRASPRLPRPRAGPTAPGGREQFSPEHPTCHSPGTRGPGHQPPGPRSLQPGQVPQPLQEEPLAGGKHRSARSHNMKDRPPCRFWAPSPLLR